MRRFLDFIERACRKEAQRVLALQSPSIKMGNVLEWKPETPHLARVVLWPEGVQTNWIPVASMWIGNGWGALASMAEGDQVVVVIPEHSQNQGVIVGRLFDERNKPPAGAKAGDLLLVGPPNEDKTPNQIVISTSNGKVTIQCSGTAIVAAPLCQIGDSKQPYHSVLLDNGHASIALKAN